MKVGFYGHVKQYHNIKEEIDANIKTVLESGSYVMGPMLTQCEEELKAYMGTKYAIGVGNGTDAIYLSLIALGVGPGDEVITHPNTFFATAEAAWIVGCKVVFVDCDEDTRCIDPAKIEAAITDKTKAILPVHLYGQCAPMKEIRAIADKHDLFVIEDNAQGIDGHGDGFKQGELSDTVCTSFIIQKNLGCFGDGGAVFTNNPDVDAKVRKLRNHGSDARNHHSQGFNSRLDDLQAGVVSAKLKHITKWTDQRIAWAGQYTDKLAGAKNFSLPTVRPGYRHVFHLYVLEVNDSAKRDALVAFLQENGIDAKTHYSIPIHKQNGFPWGKEYSFHGTFENAERNADSCVSLPLYPELTQEEADYVCEKVLEWDSAQ